MGGESRPSSTKCDELVLLVSGAFRVSTVDVEEVQMCYLKTSVIC